MRVVGGGLSGRRFHPPAGIPARPTTDVAKEGLFNTLSHMVRFDGITTCDIFAGTGSISYELASRGAEELWLVEKDPKSVRFIRQTADLFDLTERMNIMRSDVFKFLDRCTEQFDLIFAGPPYALGRLVDLPGIIRQKQFLRNKGVFVLEHTPAYDFQQEQGFLKSKNYGTTVFSFFTYDNED